METPFSSWYESPFQQRRSFSHHPSLFGVPVHPVDPSPNTLQSAYDYRQPPVEMKSERKVVRIPVQFLGSDSDRRSESALRIQKVFRGFLARKSIKKIKEIKYEVDEIEVRLSRAEVVAMIRKNERERLKMSESLMNLLLKLDGIRGIDWGIRACRKGVTIKAIALQEKIDAICAPHYEGNKVGIGREELEDAAESIEKAELEGSGLEISNDFEEMLGGSKGLNSVLGECEQVEVERGSVLSEELDGVVASEVNPSEETETEKEACLKNLDSGEGNAETAKEMLAYSVEMEVEGDAVVASEVNPSEETCLDSDHGEELKGSESLVRELRQEGPKNIDFVEKEEVNKGLLEQMMEENKKMMVMMSQLYERNEMQLQMLDGLTNRVELLEKAYLCDKLRNKMKNKKKKRNKCTSTTPTED